MDEKETANEVEAFYSSSMCPEGWLKQPIDPPNVESQPGPIEALSEKYDVIDYPDLLLLDKDGNLISRGSIPRNFVFERTPEEAVARFPWLPLTLQDAAANYGDFRKADGSNVSLETIKKGLVGFLFSPTGEVDDTVSVPLIGSLLRGSHACVNDSSKMMTP